MRKLSIFLLLSLCALVCRAQEDSYLGLWTDIQLNHNFSEKWYGSVRAEYRGTDNLKSTECWFIRPVVGYKFTSWLKFDVGYDFLKKPSSLNHRGLFSLTGTLKQGGLSVSLRERYIYAYNQDAKKSSHVLRTQLKAQYKIPQSMFKPYVAVELFTWEKWQKTRHYVGTLMNVAKNFDIDLFYMYYTFNGKPSEHVLGAGVMINL